MTVRTDSKPAAPTPQVMTQYSKSNTKASGSNPAQWGSKEETNNISRILQISNLDRNTVSGL